jgi:gas vesicle protein
MNKSRIYYSNDAEAKAIRQMTIMTLIWLAVGLGIGAIMALFFAPTSSKKLRKSLSKNFEEGLNSGQEAIEPVVKKLEKEVADLRHTLEDRIAKLK